MDNPKVVIGSGTFGRSLIARAPIAEGEVIAEFDGDVYESETATQLPNTVVNHAIQFEEHKWRDSKGFARYVNHSCDPNCRIEDLFTLKAKRSIEKEEELTWDYGMTEDSDWRMECQRGEEGCRGLIGSFSLVPESIRISRRNDISDWLIKKYGL